MFLMDELPEHLRGPASKVVETFEQETTTRQLTVAESLQVAGHLYEVMWLLYLQTMIVEAQQNAGTVIGYAHKVQENLTNCLIGWARQKGKENGRNSTNLIQVPR